MIDQTLQPAHIIIIQLRPNQHLYAQTLDSFKNHTNNNYKNDYQQKHRSWVSKCEKNTKWYLVRLVFSFKYLRQALQLFS